MRSLRLGFLHLAPVVGDLDGNRRLIERATSTAAEQGADWALSGELVVPGYGFDSLIGTDWITEGPSGWLRAYTELCAAMNLAAFVSDPERTDDGLFNTAWAVGRNGQILGSHRKLSPTPGSEDWSCAGGELAVTDVDGVRVGMLVCADAYKPDAAAQFAEGGAEVIVSLAAWWPGPYGPNGEWEQRSVETGLPMFVCNRTGQESIGDLTGSVSTVVAEGRRLVELTSTTSTLFVVDVSIPKASGPIGAQLVAEVPVPGY